MKTNTKGIRYLGSKNKIIPLILDVTNSLSLSEQTVIDIFTGTTRVAQAYKQNGWDVTTSDLSWASESYSYNFICNEGEHHTLQKYCDHLNSLDGIEGWLTNNYCDARGDKDGIVRVWKRHNGMKADAIRDEIENMQLEKWEKMALITSLIFSLDKVDNTVGLQQAYLKDWKSKRVDKLIEMKPILGPSGSIGKHIVGNCLQIAYDSAEVAYLDPPYTPADYSTYYHIWDSITRWDKPNVSLKTNRRIDRVKSGDKYDMKMRSPWYSKKSALKATKQLVDRLPVKYCIFSYSDEGLIPYDDMKEMCSSYKSHQFHERKHDRHIMSRIGAGGGDAENADKKKNIEYVITIQK